MKLKALPGKLIIKVIDQVDTSPNKGAIINPRYNPPFIGLVVDSASTEVLAGEKVLLSSTAYDPISVNGEAFITTIPATLICKVEYEKEQTGEATG